jgi:hypothetical protein
MRPFTIGGHSACRAFNKGVTMTTLSQISDAEVFSPKDEFLGERKVKCTFSFRRSKDAPRYKKECLIDFTGVSEQQLMDLALYSVKVKVQSLLRQLSPEVAINSETLSTVNVLRDLIEGGTKVPADPIEGAVKSLMRALSVTEDVARAMFNDAQKKAAASKPQPKAVKAA